METFVALLRAVNVGGTNPLPMADFKAMLADTGLHTPKTYLQSGNAVFLSDLTAAAVSDRIADAVLAGFGFRPPVFVLTAPQMLAAAASNPFSQSAPDPTHVHAFFAERELPDATLAFLKSVAGPEDRYAIRGRVLWLYLPQGIGRSKMAARVAALPIAMTARNSKTVAALSGMAAKMAGVA